MLLDQSSQEANTKYTIYKIDEVTINAKKVNWKVIIMLLIFRATNKSTIPFDPSISQKIVIKCIMEASPVRLAKSDRLGVKVVGPLSEMNWPISEETVNGWFTKILLGWFNFLNAKRCTTEPLNCIKTYCCTINLITM